MDVQKYERSKQFWGINFLVTNLAKEIEGSENYWVQKYHGLRKMKGPKKFGSKYTMGPKKIWVSMS